MQPKRLNPRQSLRAEYRGLFIGYAVISLLAGARVFSVIFTMIVANANGCVVHEGNANPRVVMGRDIGYPSGGPSITCRTSIGMFSGWPSGPGAADTRAASSYACCGESTFTIQ